MDNDYVSGDGISVQLEGKFVKLVLEGHGHAVNLTYRMYPVKARRVAEILAKLADIAEERVSSGEEVKP